MSSGSRRQFHRRFCQRPEIQGLSFGYQKRNPVAQANRSFYRQPPGIQGDGGATPAIIRTLFGNHGRHVLRLSACFRFRSIWQRAEPRPICPKFLLVCFTLLLVAAQKSERVYFPFHKDQSAEEIWYFRRAATIARNHVCLQELRNQPHPWNRVPCSQRITTEKPVRSIYERGTEKVSPLKIISLLILIRVKSSLLIHIVGIAPILKVDYSHFLK